MPGVYQLVVGLVDRAANYWENVMHFNDDESSTSDEWLTARDLCQTFITSLSSLYADMLSDDATINFLSAKKVSGTGGPTGFADISVSGTNSADMMPSVVAADFAVFPGGLKNRAGHMYISGIPNTAFHDNAWDGSWTPSAAAFITAVLGLSSSNAGNVIHYGTYTKSTKTCTNAVHMALTTKPTGLNKRALPIL